MHLDGKTNREIARDLKKSKDTINKYVKEYEENRRKLYEENPLIDREQIIESFVQKPLYDSSGRHATKMTDEVEEEIRSFIPDFEEILITTAGATITTHCGPNTLGILFIRSE